MKKLPKLIRQIYKTKVEDLTFKDLRDFLLYFNLINKSDMVIIKDRNKK